MPYFCVPLVLWKSELYSDKFLAGMEFRCSCGSSSPDSYRDGRASRLRRDQGRDGHQASLTEDTSNESFLCGSSSFGRARPCQGRGGRFEPGLPL